MLNINNYNRFFSFKLLFLTNSHDVIRMKELRLFYI